MASEGERCLDGDWGGGGGGEEAHGGKCDGEGFQEIRGPASQMSHFGRWIWLTSRLDVGDFSLV